MLACAGPAVVSLAVLRRRAEKLLAGLATPDELQAVLRSLPHNPTMEMDLHSGRSRGQFARTRRHARRCATARLRT
jgi:hypothetical protein